MKFPKEVEDNKMKFILIKEYKRFGLYESVKGKYKTCFDAYNLGLIKKISVRDMFNLLNKND